MILLVLIETVGRGTVSVREGLDLLTMLVTRDTIDEDAMATVEMGWDVTAVTVTGKGTTVAAVVDITGITGDTETDTVGSGVAVKLADIFGIATDDIFGISGVETASNLVTVAEALGGTGTVSGTSADELGTLVTMTELDVVSTGGTAVVARTAWLRGCSPLTVTTDSLMSGMTEVGVDGVDC